MFQKSILTVHCLLAGKAADTITNMGNFCHRLEIVVSNEVLTGSQLFKDCT